MAIKFETIPAIFFLYDHLIDKNGALLLNEKIEAFIQKKSETHIFKKRKTSYPENALLFVMVPDIAFLEWMAYIKDVPVTIVPLPYSGNKGLQDEFALPPTVDEVLKLLNDEKSYISNHFLFCNNKPFIGCLSVGGSKWVNEGFTSNGYKKIWRFLTKLFRLRLRAVEMTTSKGQKIETAALFIEAGRESLLTRRRPNLFKAEENQCWRISAVVYAPQSVLETLKFFFFRSRSTQPLSDLLPKGVGTIKSQKLSLHASDGNPLFLTCNGKKIETDTVEIESVQIKAMIVTGEKGCANFEEKENVRVQNLPTDNDLIAFFTKITLPFIPITTESTFETTFAQLFTKLKESIVMSTAYLILLIVSVLMATTGLFQNSSPTIIGAMVLAPLMGPIVTFAMGAIRFDRYMVTQSVRTMFFSILISLTASAFLAWVLPFTYVTEQISMRTHPTLLDLAVAVLAGIAAAYGYANSKVGENLAGVAIAVALVPPLSVAGIGIGWGAWHLFSNAFLLFLTNIIGIIFASASMFYLMGFASRKYASTAFFVKLLIVSIIIAIPLWLSTRTLVVEEKIYSTFKRIEKAPPPLPGLFIHLQRVEKKADGFYAIVSVISTSEIGEKEKIKIKRYLKKKVGKNVHLIFTYGEMY